MNVKFGRGDYRPIVLIGEHQSIMRNLAQVEIPRMSPREARKGAFQGGPGMAASQFG